MVDINPVPSFQNNSAAVGAGSVNIAEKPEINTQQVTPVKENENPDVNLRNALDPETLIRKALARNTIKDQKDLFNFRVTRYGNDLTFTNVKTGEVTRTGLGQVVGDTIFNTAV